VLELLHGKDADGWECSSQDVSGSEDAKGSYRERLEAEGQPGGQRIH